MTAVKDARIDVHDVRLRPADSGAISVLKGAVVTALALALGVSAFLAGQHAGRNSTPEVTFADAMGEAYPELERVDAMLYGWFVCEGYAEGWTSEETAEWLAGEPADFYRVADGEAFGRFVVEHAAPMCP
jgi:hypothetical protein